MRDYKIKSNQSNQNTIMATSFDQLSQTQALTRNLLELLDAYPHLAQVVSPAQLEAAAAGWLDEWLVQLETSIHEPDFIVHWDIPDKGGFGAIEPDAKIIAKNYAGSGELPVRCSSMINHKTMCEQAGATGRSDQYDRCTWSPVLWGFGNCELNANYFVELVTQLRDIRPGQDVPRNLPVTALLLELPHTEAEHQLARATARAFAEAQQVTYEDMLVAIYVMGYTRFIMTTSADKQFNAMTVSHTVMPLLQRLVHMMLPFHLKMTIATEILQIAVTADEPTRSWSTMSAGEKVLQVLFVAYLGASIVQAIKPQGPTLPEMLAAGRKYYQTSGTDFSQPSRDDTFLQDNSIATQKQLKKAYRMWAIKNHPDKRKGNQDKFIRGTEVYERLLRQLSR
jgi:hypothetical protein